MRRFADPVTVIVVAAAVADPVPDRERAEENGEREQREPGGQGEALEAHGSA
jgi:hypothetical protein